MIKTACRLKEKNPKKYYLPFQKCMILHLLNLASPLHKDALSQVWLKLVHWFWRRFMKVGNVLSPCCYYFPLEMDVALH